MELKLLKNWERVNEIYPLKNDQGLKNIDNLLAPCKKVVSVFFVDEKPKTGLGVFDRMIRDYKKITPNLKMSLAGKLKVKENILPIYIIRNTQTSDFMAHIFFEKEDKLFVLIFGIEKYERQIVKIAGKNPVFLQTVKLLEENL